MIVRINIKSIVKTLSGTGTPIDWINTAKVAIPLALVSVVVSFLFIYLYITAITAPVQDAIHKISSISNSISQWFDKAFNFITGNGWVDDENKFISKLESVYNDYKDDGICIDDTLISATLMYKYVVSSDPEKEDDINNVRYIIIYI